MVTYSVLSPEETATPVASRRRPDDPGRLATYAVLAVAAHDIASRHGFSLTPEARTLLAEPAAQGARRGLVVRALHFVGLRYATRLLSRFGPLAFVWPAREAARVYLLGRLFERYVERARSGRPVRVDEEEARRVRRAIDGAVRRALAMHTPPPEEPTAVDDQRDATTAVFDAVLALAVAAPGRLARRLDAAFDELIESLDG